MEGEMESSSGSNAVELQGSTADQQPKTGGWVAATLILGIELCERLSTMGIAVNLVTYLNETMNLSSATSANIVTNFLGTSFLLCLFGGFLADTFLGRYRVIAIFAPVQTIGTAMLAISTQVPQLRPPTCASQSRNECQQASSSQMVALYGSLYLIAIGTGGIKSSVSGFGSDQFDENNKREKAQMTLFFSRFFFLISLGTLTAVTLLVYVQDRVSRSWGYGICSVSMFIATLLFLMGTRRYRFKDSCGSPLIHILQVLVAATKKRKLQLPSNSDELFEDIQDVSTRIPHTDQFRCLDKAAVISKETETCKNIASNPWNLSSTTKVEEVKMMIRLLPIWATTIMFWTTYAQMITFSVEQATTLRRKFGHFEIPAASLTVFFVAAILVSLAAYDRLIIPFCKRWTGLPGLTNLQRIGLGLFLASLGMAAAAIAEAKRLSVAKFTAPNTTLPLSVYILIPQFLLIGSGEAFMYSGQLDFFITQSPKAMKTMSTGLFLTTLSMGFFFSSLIVSIVQKITTIGGGKGWVAEKINQGRLDCFYALLALLTFIDFWIYLVCAAWYKPQTTYEKNQEMVTDKVLVVSTMEEVLV
ncbi:OLC1v1032877C1 [Oldenlandia corymbosa var. corymbosa]|uniref:OLC1v1032877C1 n=1 Tax=Oldenlandia corymbosa var. corymbosa TaxID=529605 RepID=A0AAV1CLY4_OLDCO|nr:OLC1v1032877C1 [Oldenlandia corymbosa var. corymbosa]